MSAYAVILVIGVIVFLVAGFSGRGAKYPTFSVVGNVDNEYLLSLVKAGRLDPPEGQPLPTFTLSEEEWEVGGGRYVGVRLINTSPYRAMFGANAKICVLDDGLPNCPVPVTLMWDGTKEVQRILEPGGSDRLIVAVVGRPEDTRLAVPFTHRVCINILGNRAFPSAGAWSVACRTKWPFRSLAQKPLVRFDLDVLSWDFSFHSAMSRESRSYMVGTDLFERVLDDDGGTQRVCHFVGTTES